MRLTYIITVYNTQELIPRCINSVLNQDVKPEDYEILLVDNGSTDGSGDICDEYTRKYSNVRVLHLENLGAGASRNSGVLNAKGEYIWYLDSDDTIEPNVVGWLLQKAESDNLDVLGFDLQLAYEDEDLNISRYEPFPIYCETPGKVMSGEEFCLKVSMPSAQWCSLYRRQFLLDNNLRFIEKITYEDQDYTPRAYSLSKKSSFVHVVVYNYVQRAGSITKRTDQQERRAHDYITVCDSLYSFAKDKYEVGTPMYDYFMGKITFDFAQALRFCKSNFSIINDMENKPYYPLYISKDVSWKERIKYYIINFSIPMYLTFYKVFKK